MFPWYVSVPLKDTRQKFYLLSALLLAAVLFCAGTGISRAASPGNSGSRPSTMPVNTSGMAQPARMSAGGDASVQNAQATQRKPSAAGKKKAAQKTAKKADISGFNGNPFELERKNGGAARKAAARTGPSFNAPAEKSAAMAGQEEEDEKKLTLSGHIPTSSDDRLVPQRKVFSGGLHTLPYMDEEGTPEMSMTYKMSKSAAARLTVNPQDENSPLYRPVVRDGASINGAGVYMNVEVDQNVQLQVGGEYRTVENGHDSHDEDGQGAAVGLIWSF